MIVCLFVNRIIQILLVQSCHLYMIHFRSYRNMKDIQDIKKY